MKSRALYKTGDRVQILPRGQGIVIEACRFGYNYRVRLLGGKGGVVKLPPTKIAGRLVNGRLVKPE